MYHRFVMRNAKPHPQNDGLINIGSSLWVNDHFPREIDAELGKLIRWFNHYLLVPKKIPESGLFWFKDEPRFVEKGIELTAFLTKHGKPAVHLRTEDPGEILFQDKYQVIAKFNRKIK